MTVRELIKSADKDYCVDVYDNYTEELGIAYCGNKLTEEGERCFIKALELNIESIQEDCVIIEVDNKNFTEEQTENNLSEAKMLFESMAGFCSQSCYDKWFCD